MRHCRANRIALIVAMTAMVAGAGASLADTIACPRIPVPPVLDGRLDDWPPLPQLVIADASDWNAASPQFAQYGGPRDVSAEVRLAWDSQALYVAVETTDDTIIRVRSAAEIDRGDSIVLALKGENSDVVNQFVVALLATRTSLVWRAEPVQSAGELRSAGRGLATREEDDAKKIVYELAFPWTDLRQIRPLPGAAFTLTVSACDDDGAGLKGCLERSASVRLSTAGIGPLGSSEGAGGANRLAPSFAAPDVARFDEKAFVLNRSDDLLLGGEIEYWQLPEGAWQQRLDLLKAAGMNLVGVTVPWSHYQPLRQPADLADLRRFLELCKTSGLRAQVNIGPLASERLPAGGLPGWAIALSPQERDQAARDWVQSLLAVLNECQATKGGPVISVIARPLPDASGLTSPRNLEQLQTSIRASGIAVPILTANAPAARAGTRQSMANLLDTLSFYEPVDAGSIAAQTRSLASEEIGPAAITALPGDYHGEVQARRSIDLAKVALANGAASIMLSDFAPGCDSSAPRRPGADISGVVDAAGSVTSGYAEMRLLGVSARQFGPALVRGTTAPGIAETDDPDVRATVRHGKEQSFLFLWDEKARRPHQVRVGYLAPDSEARISIPEAGTINLPAGGAKVLLLETPFGRGTIRYCTSEVLGIHQVGDRWVLTVYGEVDTSGEIAIRLPGPPLVSGDAARQSWNDETKTLTLDYYHGEKDRYLLADELEIAILSRERAASAGFAVDGPQGATVVAGGNVMGISTEAQGLRATIDCRAGVSEVTAAVMQTPSSVIVDGKPVPFAFRSPERVVSFQLATPALSEERRATNVLDRLGRVIAGGPARSHARFDRADFRPDADAPEGDCSLRDQITGGDDLAIAPGSFVRLKSEFTAERPAELRVTESAYPLLTSINGKLVEGLSVYGGDRSADVSSFLRGGSNEIAIVGYVLPRDAGLKGMREVNRRLPEVKIATPSGAIAPSPWQLCPSLRGELAGWGSRNVAEGPWHFIRLGAWREQGSALADVKGVGWYRMAFGLAQADGWSIPYYLDFDLRGGGKVYFNGLPIGAAQEDGAYHLPVPSSVAERDNILAIAVYGSAADTGLYSANVEADESKMTRRRTVEIRF